MGRDRYYPSLDGLRGVAALCVVVLHRGEWFGLGPWLAHGYLAVDFFFMLSGFVVANAYEARLKGRGAAGVLNFCRARVIRLYPLIVLGVLIGASWRWVAGAFDAPTLPQPEIVVLAIKGMLTIPTLERNAAGVGVFPLDGPTWSLFFEVVANLAWVLVLPWLTTRRLAWAVGLSALALVWMAFRHAGVETGATPRTFWDGFLRTAFPFFAGVLLWRMKDRAALAWPALPVWAPALALLIVLNLPVRAEGAGALIDLACVLLVFPAILALAVRGRPRARTAAACRTLGELSYPVYVLHYPIYVIMGGVAWHEGWLTEATERALGWTSLGVIVVVSAAALVLYDRPLRRWLGCLGRSRPAGSASVEQPAQPARELADA
jgi:peptidoglycan/LPS O-acetylase OafA/YrhL